MRVLDVATGTGNVALRAAQRGASVTALDLKPAQLAARARAEAGGLEIEWVEADAQDLPFADDDVRRRHLRGRRDLRPRPSQPSAARAAARRPAPAARSG